MNLDYQKKSQEIVEWVRKTVDGAGFTDVVIALSGGIDSTVSAALSVKAFGKEHVHVLLLPYSNLHEEGVRDAKKVVDFLELSKGNVHVIDIRKSVESFTWDSATPNLLEIRKGNIMARVRMIYLYDFAKANNCLVVGTENKSEYHLGYFTRFGDEASDIEPIRGLYKTQVKELAAYLAIPKEIIAKAPTAGLWEGQSDEEEFGFSYADADQILYHYFDEGLSEGAIVGLGIEEEVVKKVLSWVTKNDFKHNVPKICK